MTIKKNPDGTTTHTGVAIPIAECFAQTLGLRLLYLNYKSRFIILIKDLTNDNLDLNIFHLK